jgi:hypothetical protein
MKCIGILLIALSLVACQDLRRADSRSARANAVAPTMQGVFDNHEQVWSARETAPTAATPSHVVVSIEATPQADWSIWRIRLDATPELDATWAIRTAAEANGAIVLIPYRALVATPAEASAFDAKQWTPLEACALHSAARATAGLQVRADTAACTAIAPGVGAQAALLPLVIERDGEWLHVRLYADQARGADAREDARLVQWFGGWAAINGGGPKADANSRDWHMNRGLRIGSEGGRFALKWRDNSAAGYSLMLERLTYREGNVPVLKLSVVEDADGRTLAYSWANPEATRIGINLGWMQVGLDRDSVLPSDAKNAGKP